MQRWLGLPGSQEAGFVYAGCRLLGTDEQNQVPKPRVFVLEGVLGCVM